MRKVLLAGIAALAASTSLAQTEPDASALTSAKGPANLCQELLAFITPPSGAPAAPASSDQADSTQGADAPTAPTAEPNAAAKAPPAGVGAAPESGAAVTGEDSAPASGEAVPPQSVDNTQSAQDASGQSGPAHEAPEPSSEPVEEGKAQNAELKSSLSAPAPTDATSTPKDSVLSMVEAEKLADANDIAACQAAARELRLAGVDMPAPLLALTALDLRYQQ